MSYRVFNLDTVEANAGLFLVELAALEIGLSRRFLLIGRDLVPVIYLVLPLLEHRMLGRNDHVSGAEQSIGTGGVNGDLAADIGLEGNLSAGGAADPVALLDLYALDVIDIVKIVDKALSVLGYAQHPLALFLADDLAAAALAHTVDDLFVCENTLAGGAPVDGHGGLVCKAVLVHLKEYPLSPLVILRIGRVYNSVPVKAVAEHFQLRGEGLYVIGGDLCRMDVCLYGVVFRRQTEGVKAYGIKDIVAVHSLLAANYVKRGEGSGMADVQSLSGGIRELDKTVKFGACGVAGYGRVGLGLFPYFLPFLFNCCKIVFHFNITPL